MEVEAHVLGILVQSDRAQVAAMADPALALLLVDELLVLGVVDESTAGYARVLLGDNANALHGLVRDKPNHPPSREDWDLLRPDWAAVRRYLGEAGAAEWKARIAGQARQVTRASEATPSAAA